MTDRMRAIRDRRHQRMIDGYPNGQEIEHDINWLLGQVDLARQDAEGLAAALFDNRPETIWLALERHRDAVILRGAK